MVQLGEEPWRVHNVGALSVDNLHLVDNIDKDEFLNKFNLSEVFLLVTFHPVTLEIEHVHNQVDNLMRALDSWGGDVLFTMPNTDPGGKLIRDQINKNVNVHKNWISVENLGTRGYYSAMRYASAMVGNSSSGIIESGLFNLPVVNIGTRQNGRIRGANIIDVGYDKKEVLQGIKHALSIKIDGQIDLPSPYGDGKAAEKIVGILRNIEINDQLLIKKFFDL
ncbi:MAG: UDP-N-acetylglucosamine 2-epimerase [Anaerolineales bacterium]|nr:UDP-N-acetylglucosamine 2-epimerase [Anaerolineales bacterium]